MDDELTLIIAKTEQINDSIKTLLTAYDKWKDLGDNVYGGYLYNCLRETKLIAEEYQKEQIIKYLKSKGDMLFFPIRKEATSSAIVDYLTDNNKKL